MGTLRDEVYEGLDYLSQLTEVIIGPQNEILGRAPDRVTLTFDQINKIKSRSWGGPAFSLSTGTALMQFLNHTDWPYVSEISSHFKFEISDDFELDLANR